MDTFAILTGTRTQHLHILLQLVPVYSQHVLLQQVFARSEVDVNDIDFEKYSILKRITEVSNVLDAE